MSTDMRVKDWNKFQHFKDRTPPWIKLYRGLLDDLEWHELDPAAAKTLVMIWLMASEDDGRIPCLKKLAFRLRQTESKTSDHISKLSHWLISDDIEAISSSHQSDAPETETETETETEVEVEREEKAPRKRVAPSIKKPDEVTDQVWSDWLELRKAKRAPVTQTVVDGAASEAAKAGMTLDGFLSVWCSRGSQGLQAEWIKPHERTAGQPQSFKDGDRRKAAENIAAWTGGLAHDRSALGGPIPGLQTSFVIEGEAYEQRQIAG